MQTSGWEGFGLSGVSFGFGVSVKIGEVKGVVLEMSFDFKSSDFVAEEVFSITVSVVSDEV